MAEVLTSPPASAEAQTAAPGWWPVDVLVTAYLAATGLLIAAYWRRVPGAAWLFALHVLGIVSIVLAVKITPARRSTVYNLRSVFRHWYPLPYVAACYKEMAILIPPIRGTDLDAEMAHLDFALWHVNPTVWLERIANPWLTEFLQITYTLFVPAVLLVAVLLWWKHRFSEFRYYAFLIALGFLASYVGYFLVPVRGPRFFMADLHHFPLRGLWLFHGMQGLLDRLESAHYDCFPSGHTELTLLAWWSSRRISKELFAAFSVYSVCIIFATVYLRYHYTIDVLAGAVLAAALLMLAPRIYHAQRQVIGSG